MMGESAQPAAANTQRSSTPLRTYRQLGRSGLRVSPLALGAMTFGTAANRWGSEWRADEDTARTIINRFAEAGGNMIDTADVYGGGQSEEIVGRALKELGLRERMVLSTKFSSPTVPNDPNGWGNGTKHLRQSLEASLRRLGTDHVDLYWLHAWDVISRPDDVVAALDRFVRNGSALAIGLSNVPAWFAAKAQMLADLYGQAPIVALQMQYSLAERSIEREHLDMAEAHDIDIVAWSPLANGLLSGKYRRKGNDAEGKGRLEHFKGVPGAVAPGEREWAIVDTLRRAAMTLDRSMAEIAINWVMHRPRVATAIIGAKSVEQLDQNMQANTFELPEEIRRQLDEVSAPALNYPYELFTQAHLQRISSSSLTIERVRRWHVSR